MLLFKQKKNHKRTVQKVELNTIEKSTDGKTVVEFGTNGLQAEEARCYLRIVVGEDLAQFITVNPSIVNKNKGIDIIGKEIVITFKYCAAFFFIADVIDLIWAPMKSVIDEYDNITKGDVE